MSFQGFSPQTARFLRDLDKNNTREWFEKHRPGYEEHLMAPAREFVLAMADKLDKFDPAIEATPKVNRSIRRINRDTRFSKDKRPYKNHFDFYFPHSGFKDRPGYWLRITPKQIGIGAGLHSFDDKVLAKWRKAVAADAPENFSPRRLPNSKEPITTSSESTTSGSPAGSMPIIPGQIC
jgi:uncharacterized protein (TIGR02453 family)